jgi:hypothetical protein
MNVYLWPDTPRATRAEILDRLRLVADLDEATAPESPPSVLLIVGRPRVPGWEPNEEPPPDLVQFSDRLAEMVAVRGSVYRTRATELCALIDVGPSKFVRLLAAIEAHLRSEGADEALSVGYVTLPADEVPDAAAALKIADSRLAAPAPELHPMATPQANAWQ